MRWTCRLGVLLVLTVFLCLACGGGEDDAAKMQQEMEKKLAEVKAGKVDKNVEIAMATPQPAAAPGGAAPAGEGGTSVVRYETANRPDPFSPFKPEVIPTMLGISDNPLLRYEVRFFKLVGIISGGNAPTAIFEDPSGRSYNVRVGDAIGKNAGIVKSITADQVVVVETKPSWTEEGTETVETVIWLRPEEHILE